MTDYLKDAAESDLAARIRAAIGATPTEDVAVTTPQFERTDGKEIDWYPEDPMDIYGLIRADTQTLLDLGMQNWNGEIWLFPAQWYDHIPDGTLIVDINDRIETFEHGVTDNDRRFGALPYGIKRDSEYADTETETDPDAGAGVDTPALEYDPDP